MLVGRLRAILILGVCGLLWVSRVFPTVVRATGGSQQIVQAAINSAASGDTIEIPGGTYVWSSPLTIGKAITLTGGGSYAVAGNHDDAGTWPVVISFSALPSNRSGIEISGPSGAFIRITGFHFTGTVPGGTTGDGAVRASESNLADWRVDNCKFTVSGNSVASRSSGLGGLVDHIYATSAGCDTNTAVVAMDNRNSYEGNWAIAQPIGFGGPGFLYIEDSTFIRNCTTSSAATDAIDAQAGGKIVFRHNYVRNAMVGWHGSETGAPQRSGYAFEIYENEFFWTLPNDKYHSAILQRGGAALIYNNTATNYQAFWKSWVYRATNAFGIFGQADGTKAWDGNWGGAYPTGYPVLDQPGTGQAAGVALTAVQPQQTSKVYLWNNTLINTNPVFHNNPTYVVQGRDYEISGDSSVRPGWYSPYPYPHPLRKGSIAPDPPTRMRVVP